MAVLRFAWPDRVVSVAVSVGCLPDLVWCLSVSPSLSFGLNPSPAQSPTWKREDTGADRPPVEVSVAVSSVALQEVGLIMNPGRSSVTSTRRSLSGMPSRIVGSGSETTVTCAFVGLIWIDWRTTTVPRLSGPATAGVTTASP